MSVEELLGQMSQIDINVILDYSTHQLDLDLAEHYIGKLGIGSVLNLPQGDADWDARQYRRIMIELNTIAAKYNRPPLLWGLDSGHGANYIRNAILTPQPINLAATFNVSAAFAAGQLASRDTRAAGIAWIYGPMADVATMPLWPRVFETLGEDPLVVGKLAAAMVRGIQQDDTQSEAVPRRAAASVKHFIGYPTSRTGHDRDPSWIPTRHLYQYFVKPWQRVIHEGGAKTIMGSYTEVDGVPVTLNNALLQELLRDRLGFEGVFITDYEEVYNAWQWHHVVESKEASVVKALSLSDSLDVSMIPWDVNTTYTAVAKAVESGQLDKHRLKTSARRVMHLKDTLGLLTRTPMTMDDPNLDLVGTDREQVYAGMVHDSLILAENKQQLLPLDPASPLKILVTGPTAHSMGSQSGAWTRQWLGTDDRNLYSYGSTVWDSLQAASPHWETSYRCGVGVGGQHCSTTEDQQRDVSSIDLAVEAATAADVTVICVGEERYAEKGGDLNSLRLADGQYALVDAIRRQAPSTKIILVYFGGRARTLPQNIDTVVLGFVPGPDAGRALADIVTGAVNPSGRLPITYPASDNLGGVPYWHAVSEKCTQGTGPLPHSEFVRCEPAWPFGHGLSYTQFSYTNFEATGGIDRDLTFNVSVTNTGRRGGAEAVLFFTFDEFRSVTPEYKQLRAFHKIFLEPGESTTVVQVVPVDDLRFVGPDSDKHYVLDPDMKSYAAVGYDTDCRERTDEGGIVDSEFCVLLESDKSTQPNFPVCEAACQLWGEFGCFSYNKPSQQQCFDTCRAANRYPTGRWSWNYVECLEQVGWLHPASKPGEMCEKLTSYCRDIAVLHTPEVNIHQTNAAVLVTLMCSLAAILCLVLLRGVGFTKTKIIGHDGRLSAIRYTKLKNGRLE